MKKTSVNDKGKEFAEKAEKKKAKEEEAFLNSLYKTVKVVKQTEIDEGDESKNFLCQFFKAGLCDKGDLCEFSHDLNIEFNQGAFDIYTDLRDAKRNMNAESEIHKIANEKEQKRSKVPQSNIICKFFLDAVIKKVYGWKWECPNGDDCHYKHCLPKNFVIPTGKDKMQEEMSIEEYMDLEEQIDAERERVAKNGRPVNDVTFKEWKEKRDELRKNQKAEEETKKKALTGIQLFKKQANLFKDDENAGTEVIKVDDTNQIEDVIEPVKSEKEIIEELENKLNGVKINTELFSGENLDDLDGLDDENLDEEANEDGIEEESKNN